LLRKGESSEDHGEVAEDGALEEELGVEDDGELGEVPLELAVEAADRLFEPPS